MVSLNYSGNPERACQFDTIQSKFTSLTVLRSTGKCQSNQRKQRIQSDCIGILVSTKLAHYFLHSGLQMANSIPLCCHAE